MRVHLEEIAERSTENEERPTAEVGDCGPTEQEIDICKHPDEFPESGRLDKDSNSASKKVGKAVSYADIFLQTVSRNFTVDKDDKMHPETSVQADEQRNTSSKSGMHEKEFPVSNNIANTEEVSILENEFSKPEFSDTVTSTDMCSNKELEEDSNQRLTTVESCLMREESGTNICIDLSTSNVVADSVTGENNNSQPTAPSSPVRGTEFDNIMVDVNEELKPEDSPLSWRSYIFERAALDGSALQKERNSAESIDVSELNHSKNSEVKSKDRKKVVAEVKELKLKDSSLLWSTENVPKRTTEDGSSAHKQVGIEGREVEETVCEDAVENASERTSSKFGDAHHILDNQQPMKRECDLEEMTCSISRDVEEKRMNKNISRERTLAISEHDVNRANISCPFLSILMIFATHLQRIGVERSKVEVYSTAVLPQTICEDFAGFDNQMLVDLMGSTGRRISRIGDLNIVKFEETEPSTVITDKIVPEDDAEIVTHNVSQEGCYGKDTIDSHQFEVNYGEIDGNCKVICQENDERHYLVQMDVDTNNVESLRDNLISGDTIHRFDKEADASGVPMEELPVYEDAVDADAPANLQYSGESLTLTGETNKAQGVPTEELTRSEDVMDADAPPNLQYGRESLTITGETNQAHKRGPEEISDFDIFSPELVEI
ncbi:hypothetical protein POM88_007368 [Heracleum sosnowskyi]|uniref:Uncharacterized protein n=1 Tax=Heracleum sosnowskyi TaxID=360622 RepID=A0AAD8J498_9APIA|nr:hypothetical protein POM88_007368 [Heracleum sosnowskyi]